MSRPQGVSYRLLSLRFCSYSYGTTEGWLVPEWTWDPNKDALNRQNHQGLSLTAGALVLVARVLDTAGFVNRLLRSDALASGSG